MSTGRSDRTTSNFFLIRETISYKELAFTNAEDMPLIDELVNIILDTVASKSGTIRIGKEEKPRELVKSVLMKLTYNDILHVINQFRGLTGQVKRKRAYLLSMLYYSKMELEAHYINCVQVEWETIHE